MAHAARILIRLAMALAWLSLGACASEAAGTRPTSEPVIQVTPAATQNVRATATAYARRIVATPTPPGLYVVKPGDTLSKIADDHATTIDEIMALNNLSDPNTIIVGQKLIIPSLVPSPTGAPDAPATPEAGLEANAEAATSVPEATAEATSVP